MNATPAGGGILQDNSATAMTSNRAGIWHLGERQVGEQPAPRLYDAIKFQPVLSLHSQARRGHQNGYYP